MAIAMMWQDGVVRGSRHDMRPCVQQSDTVLWQPSTWGRLLAQEMDAINARGRERRCK